MKYRKGSSVTLTLVITDMSESLDESYRVENSRGDYTWLSAKFLENSIHETPKWKASSVEFKSTPSVASSASVSYTAVEEYGREEPNIIPTFTDTIPYVRGMNWVVEDHPEFAVGTRVSHRCEEGWGVGHIIRINPGTPIMALANDRFPETGEELVRCYAPYRVEFPEQLQWSCAGENLVLEEQGG